MSIAHDTEISNLQQNFSEKLHEIQEWLKDKSIPYAVIGSVATAAYVDKEGSWALNFDRPYATSPEDRIPDIDVIVPRDSLSALRQYRETQLASTFPVSIGLSFPSRFIDMRPDESISYLTSGRKNFSIRTETLSPQPETVIGEDVLVPNVNTLYYIHHMIGRMRPSDKLKVEALSKYIDVDTEGYESYKQMLRHRQEHPGIVSRIGRAQRHLSDTHPFIAQKIHNAALPVANLIGAR